MVFTTKELMIKYKNYRSPKMKIKSEIEKGNYFKINRGLYETNKNVEPFLLAAYIKSPSYLSFEYALSYYGIIPETVYTYTSATCLEKHTYKYENVFGRYSYHDVPKEAFAKDVMHIEKDGYAYNIASKEKSLCDLLAIRPPLNTKQGLFSYLFDSLRIDEDMFQQMDYDKLIALSKLYKRKNLDLLIKLVGDFKRGKYHY